MSHKKLLSLLLAIVMAFSLAGCAGETEKPEEIVVPPVRFGTASASINAPQSLATAVRESDAVAHIRIGNWLGESEMYDDTYFEAEVIELFKGEVPDEFVLKQDGYSEFVYQMNPLFTYGNELVLFLNDVGGEYYPYDNVYWIKGSFGTIYYVGEDDAGDSYVVPNPANQLAKGVLTNMVYQTEKSGVSIGEEVAESLSASDPERWSGITVTAAYSLERLGEKVRELS